MIIILLSFTYFNIAKVVWQIVLISAVLLFLFYLWVKQLHTNSTISLLLFNDGIGQKVQLNQKQYYLTNYSRVAFWGCYLILRQVGNPAHREVSIFLQPLAYFSAMYRQRLIFVDRRILNPTQFSTMCYIIKRVQHEHRNTSLSKAI